MPDPSATPENDDEHAPVLPSEVSESVSDERMSRTTREVEQWDPASANAPGQNLPASIGPFKILELLGTGGMGAVYLGEDEKGRRAAVKVLPTSLSSQAGLLERFNREVDALNKLRSGYIVKLIGRGTEEVPGGGSLPFYAMEYVDGPTLGEAIRQRGRLPWREVIDLAVQVCRALKTAHNAGIIHRDLKPSNLMLSRLDDGSTRVKLTDFGVAQVFATGRLTITGGMVGTAEYMSPEQADGRRVTKQSDLYALGALIYAALVGRPPFSGSNPIDVAQKHRAGLFDSPQRIVPEVPHWLDELVCQCLEKKPEDRPPDAYVLERRLLEIPRKVELSESEATAAATANTPRSAASGDVGGTLVAQLVRDEIERTHRGSATSQFFDNIYVLLTLLAATLGIAFFTLSNREPSLESQFERGVELIESDDRRDWQRAIAVFAPVLDSGEAEWIERVEPYRERLAVAELMERPRRRRQIDSATTEPQRILLAARADIDAGKYESAATQLVALRRTVEDDPAMETILTLCDDLLAEIAREQSRVEQEEFIAGRIEHAKRLRDFGDIESAGKIIAGLKQLYPGRAASIDRRFLVSP